MILFLILIHGRTPYLRIVERVMYIPIEEAEYFEKVAEAVVKKMMSLGFLTDKVKSNARWLTHFEAASYIRKTPAALYKLTSERKVKYTKRGKANMYRVEDLDKYMEDGFQETAEEVVKEIKLLPKRNYSITK